MGTPDDMKRYKITHPRYMWSALDFEKAEVLDYLYQRLVDHVCREPGFALAGLCRPGRRL